MTLATGQKSLTITKPETLDRGEVPRFVDAQCAAAGQSNTGQQTETLVGRRPAEFDAFGCQLGHRGGDVVAYEIELVLRFTVGRMNPQLGGRQRKDEPALVRLHVVEIELVAKECAIGCGVLAVDQSVGTGNHAGDRSALVARGQRCGDRSTG